MSLREYLRTKAALIAIGTATIASVCLMAAVSGCPMASVTFIAVLLVLGLTVSLGIGYWQGRGFYQELDELCASLEHPYQLHSLMHRPLSPDQQRVFEALEVMGRACSEEVTRADAREGEHREFVEGWVHGIKAPLASCELVTERTSEPERSQLRYELDRMRRKVDAALWYARSDSANRDYVIRETRLLDIPTKVCRDNARFLIEHGCAPQLQIDPNLMVFTDAKQVGFIVTQLVENSAKYGARHLLFTTEQADTKDGRQAIVLHVEDDGCGIPARDIDRVFERGFTGTHGHEDASSTGMGLYLASRLCDQLGLGLTISSTEGEGTDASIAFPLDRRRLDAERDKSERLP